MSQQRKIYIMNFFFNKIVTTKLHIYTFTRVSDFYSTYKQCSMPKQSYYLGETIQHELNMEFFMKFFMEFFLS